MKALNHSNYTKVYILFHWNDKRKSENTKQETRQILQTFECFIIKKTSVKFVVIRNDYYVLDS